MKQIKFRAWDKKMGKFHPEGMVFIDFEGSPFQLGVIDKEHSERREFRYTPLDEMEIDLYTGMRDKNGKEIYEGDLEMSSVGHGLSEIRYSGHTFWKYPVNGERPEPLWNGGEIVGNIYQNPELLTK